MMKTIIENSTGKPVFIGFDGSSKLNSVNLSTHTVIEGQPPSENHVYENGSWIESKNIIDEKKLRLKRDTLLNSTDYIIIRHLEQNDLSNEEYTDWKNYRQSLRDLPEQVDLEDIVFPSAPVQEVPQ
jgi:hypothetical protein